MSAVPAPRTGPDAGAVWHYGDPLGEQRAAADGAVVVDRSHRAVLSLTGAERQAGCTPSPRSTSASCPTARSPQNLSLDGQGRVEDHWIQTELGRRTMLDTEPWRGEPLLAYLRKMVFWADVAVEPADLAVLSLLGPRLADDAGARGLGVAALPAEWTAVALPGGGFVRRMPGAPGRRARRRGAARTSRRLDRPADRGRRPAGRGVGLRGAPGGGAAAAARASTPTSGRSRTRSAGSAARRRRRAPGQGLLPRAGDRRAGPQPGQTAADAGAAAPRRVDGPARHRRPVLAGGRAGRPPRHRRRPRRPRPDRAGAAQARAARRHRIDHRRRNRGRPP